MNTLVLIAAIVAAPAVLFSLLRIDAVYVFFGLCLGDVLVKFMGGDAQSFISAFFPHSGYTETSATLIGLMLLPAIFIAAAMFHSVRGAKVLTNVIPSLCVGILALLLVEPLLSAGTRGALQNQTIWNKVVQAQTLIVGAVSLLIIVLLIVGHKQAKSATKKRH